MDKDTQHKLAVMADHFRCFSRNGRWGTCGFCPRDGEHRAYPEFCQHTKDYAHQLTIDQLAQQWRVA